VVWNRRRQLSALVLSVLLVAASVSYTGRYTLDVVDKEGRPQLAYALYVHRGEWLSVHPVSYNATQPALVRSDGTGRLTIPAALHLHFPFPLQTHPTLWIEMVYVPGLHNAGGRIGGGYAASAAGAWEIDPTWHRAVAFDLSDSPRRWQSTLSNLSFFIRPLASPRSVRETDPSTAALLLELIGHFRAEYAGFLAQYGDTPRPRPPMPMLYTDDEKRRWTEMVDEDLGRRPTWGAEIRRLHEDELSSLTEVEAALRR
jgi:hypothetical protein